jgi:hypothetical protein
MIIGAKRPLQSEDLWRMDATREAERLSARLLTNISKRQEQRDALNAALPTSKPSLPRRAYWAFKATTHSHLPKDYAAYGSDDTLAHRIATLEAEWRARSGKRAGGMALAWALLETFPELAWAIPYKVLTDASGICLPLLTKAIVRFAQQGE